MVLQDALLEKMSFSSWQTAVQAKVNTSWNLHTILPHGMDFFILLSSLSGALGIVGQSNYAAGNTFQDALAKHRSSQGEYSVALDLGLMESIGFVAENAGIGRQATRDFLHIEEHEYHALLDYYCNPEQRHKSGGSGSQVLVGLPTPGHFKSKDREVPVYLNLPELLAVKRLDAHESVSPTSQSQSNDSARAFKASKTHEEAAAVVLTGLIAKLSRSLSVGIEEIDAENTLHQYGVDSLVAVELRNWFIKEFGANLAIVDFIGAVSIMEVAGRVAAAGKAS
jgi:acyl carrier protein